MSMRLKDSLSLSGIRIANTLLFSLGGHLSLGFICHLANRLQTVFEGIASEAIGKHWNEFPKEMKIKFLNIILFSTTRRPGFTAWGMFPMNMETYYQVLQLTYSFLSFVAALT